MELRFKIPLEGAERHSNGTNGSQSIKCIASGLPALEQMLQTGLNSIGGQLTEPFGPPTLIRRCHEHVPSVRVAVDEAVVEDHGSENITDLQTKKDRCNKLHVALNAQTTRGMPLQSAYLRSEILTVRCDQ